MFKETNKFEQVILTQRANVVDKMMKKNMEGTIADYLFLELLLNLFDESSLICKDFYSFHIDFVEHLHEAFG